MTEDIFERLVRKHHERTERFADNAKISSGRIQALLDLPQTKTCEDCGNEFKTLDNRVNVCRNCYLGATEGW